LNSTLLRARPKKMAQKTTAAKLASPKALVKLLQ
jgi:hypothetical protein